MNENDISVILKKTGDYHQFISNSISSKQIPLKKEDIAFLKTVQSYLSIIDEFRSEPHYKSHTNLNIINTCLSYLEKLDVIAKKYKI